LLKEFVHLIWFDGWIGNGDRHPENWGLIRSTTAPPVLAPMYDPAACLGVELKDDLLLLNDFPQKGNPPTQTWSDKLVAYVQKCGSGLGNGDSLISMESVLREALRWPEGAAYYHAWTADFRRANEQVPHLIATIPDDWMPVVRKNLAVRLLNARLQFLETLLL